MKSRRRGSRREGTFSPLSLVVVVVVVYIGKKKEVEA